MDREKRREKRREEEEEEEEKKKREEKGKRRRRRGKEKEEEKKIKGMEFVKFCMEKYGFLYTKMDTMVCMEKSNHKPIFFYEFGFERTLLGILVVFDSFRLYLELFWFGFMVDLGLYEN